MSPQRRARFWAAAVHQARARLMGTFPTRKLLCGSYEARSGYHRLRCSFGGFYAPFGADGGGFCCRLASPPGVLLVFVVVVPPRNLGSEPLFSIFFLNERHFHDLTGDKLNIKEDIRRAKDVRQGWLAAKFGLFWSSCLERGRGGCFEGAFFQQVR